MTSTGEMLRDIRYALVHTFLEVDQSLCDSRIQGNHRTGAVGLATHSTELETVSGEGKWTGAVSVGIVDEQFRNLGDVDFHALLSSHDEEVFFVSLLDVVEQFAHLLAQETRDDSWRSLVGTQSVGVGGTHD